MQTKPPVKITKADYLALRADSHTVGTHYTVEDGEFMRRLCDEARARECSFISVIFDGDMSTDAFRVYVDRYIRAAGAMDSHLVEPHTVLARVEPGVHTVVIRDRDPKQPNRRASNALSIEIEPHQRIRIQASCIDGTLRIRYLSTEPFSDTRPESGIPGAGSVSRDVRPRSQAPRHHS